MKGDGREELTLGGHKWILSCVPLCNDDIRLIGMDTSVINGYNTDVHSKVMSGRKRFNFLHRAIRLQSANQKEVISPDVVI